MRKLLKVVAPPKSNADLRLPVAESIDDPPDGECRAGGPVGFQETDEDHATEEDG